MSNEHYKMYHRLLAAEKLLERIPELEENGHHTGPFVSELGRLVLEARVIATNFGLELEYRTSEDFLLNKPGRKATE